MIQKYNKIYLKTTGKTPFFEGVFPELNFNSD